MVFPTAEQMSWRIKPLVFITALLPLLWLVYGVFMDKLGANPIETITRDTGDWALRFLLITLTITPLRRLTGQAQWTRLRRMLGLFAFFYASLHLMTYLWFDQFFDWSEIWLDILERPFITVGMTAFVLLLPLTLTSTRAMMRRLKRNWLLLHKLIYPISMLAVLHFWWMKDSKADVYEPVIYSVILALLLGYRLLYWMRKKQVYVRMKTVESTSSYFND